MPSSSKNCIKTQIKQMGNAQFAARVFSGLSVDFCTTVIECFRVRLCKRNAISEPFDKVGVCDECNAECNSIRRLRC